MVPDPSASNVLNASRHFWINASSSTIFLLLSSLHAKMSNRCQSNTMSLNQIEWNVWSRENQVQWNGMKWQSSSMGRSRTMFTIQNQRRNKIRNHILWIGMNCNGFLHHERRGENDYRGGASSGIFSWRDSFLGEPHFFIAVVLYLHWANSNFSRPSRTERWKTKNWILFTLVSIILCRV